ncbi:chemotaxis protein CheW [Planctomycetota bacterium]
MEHLDDEILESFIEESREHLADIENDLLTIEEGGADIDEDLVNKVFRAAHSIKGGAGFMGLETIKNLAHKIENVLGMIRSQEIVPSSEVVNILLLAFDTLRDMVNNANESNGVDITEHTVALAGITSAYLPPEEKAEVNEQVEISLPDGPPLFTVAKFDLHQAEKEKHNVYVVAFDLIHDIHRRGLTPLSFLHELQDKVNVIDCTVEIGDVGTLDEEVIINCLPLYVLLSSDVTPENAAELWGVSQESVHQLTGDLTLKTVDMAGYEIVQPPADFPEPVAEPVAPMEIPIETPTVCPEVQTPTPEPEVSAEPEIPKRKAPPKMTSSSAETSLRVNVKLLDNLMNLAGELVLSRNELMQAEAQNELNLIGAATQRINLVTSELQEAIMLTRMQPIGNVFNKFPRVVRDLASALDKKIELSVSGNDVDMDKTIIEGLADPLTHLVRNSADHGIEDPAVRRKSGKSETGQIWLKAYHEAGQVNIEISDDGKGINPDKLSQSAINKGLVTEKQVEAMSDKEKIAMIFLPGFSMADKVTDVSGRGVGMDVVKTNLDKLGGQIDIDSKIGYGTTIRIKLPLTLAIIPSLMISTNEQRYALPMVNVVELLRIPAKQIKERIEQVADAEVVRLRQELLPILSLRKLLAENLDLEPDTETERETALATGRAMNIVVVSAGSFKYGLVVDQLHDSEEIVVKPLDQYLKKCRGYAGATIMGNGQVALILDVASLARMAELNLEEIAKSSLDHEDQVAIDEMKTESLLLFGCSESEKFGVPVDLVGRIERIASSDIEYSGGKKTIKYRGGILPLYGIDEVANVEPLAQRDDLLVIVFRINGHEFGLLAIPPVDTVDVAVKLDRETLRQLGIKGSAIIDDQTTLIVDIYEFIQTLNPDWVDSMPVDDQGCITTDSGGTKILYAEDSGFFRNTVRKFLEEEGYGVIDAEDGQEAWQLLQEHADEISMVLTDIEMPNLDGLGLSKKIRSDERFQHIPIIALTTLASDKDVAKGKEIGVTDYQVKLDKEKLISSIQTMLSH